MNFPNECWQLGVNNGECIEEDEILVTRGQLLPVAKLSDAKNDSRKRLQFRKCEDISQKFMYR